LPGQIGDAYEYVLKQDTIDYYGGKIGLSGSPEKVYGDYQLLRDTGLDYINVLFNGKIHQVEYNSHIKDWKFINIWIWY